MVFIGAWTVYPGLTVAAVWAALVVGGVYMIRAIRELLHGPLPDRWANLGDAPNAWRKLPFALLLACLFVFGGFPALLTRRIEPAIASWITSMQRRGAAPPVSGLRAGYAQDQSRDDSAGGRP
jgi:NADH:ubiquinone oxidoreductase subunit 4 (subunit M)